MTQTTLHVQPTVFDRIRFVMVKPSHPGNVGAAARAIKTMGFKELCLVAPKIEAVTEHPEAQALASGATDILNQTSIVPSLLHALAPVSLAFALTARPRYLGSPSLDIRQSAEIAATHASEGENLIAIVLGTERTGLTNDEIELCQHVCHIPANPEYSSLNVAQALQLAAWEMRYALMTAQQMPTINITPAKIDPGESLANGERVAAFLEHFEKAIIDIGFLDPDHPKKLVTRMRHLFNRNRLTINEVDMLRGLCTAMIKTAQKSKS